MMIFTSIYSVVDGLFVSQLAGKTAFAAINLVWPVFVIIGSIGYMIGTGGTAIVGKTLGEGKRQEANAYFSMFVYIVLFLGVVLGVIGWFIVRPLSRMLGAEGQMLSDCVLYGRVLLVALPFFLLQFAIQSFFITAEKPKLGLYVTVIGGVLNMALDALFIAGFRWGLFGAAFATALSQTIATTTALLYFASKNDSLLHLGKTRFYKKILLKACANGSSEMVMNIASSVVTIIFNYQLLRMIGEDGIAAYGVLMYVGFIFSAVFIGYSMGIAPVISYQYGAENHTELKNLFRKSMMITAVVGVSMVVISELSAAALSDFFVGYDKDLFELTVFALRIFASSFLFTGFNIFGSSFFTALNDGLVSAVISFLRTFVFAVGSVLILPIIMGINGFWFAIPAAETAALLVTLCFLYGKRNKYHYI